MLVTLSEHDEYVEYSFKLLQELAEAESVLSRQQQV